VVYNSSQFMNITDLISGDYTKALLIIHENEIRRLIDKCRLKMPMLASILKYFDICKKEKKVAMAAADQTHLLGQRPRDPGWFLYEEKIQKRVLKKKPCVSISHFHT